ncbi:MAG: DUF1328 domain-containing protein [Gemmataceae bacterium]
MHSVRKADSRKAKPGGISSYPEAPMLRYSLLFLLIALLAGIFGFTSIAGTSYLVAKVCFFVFIVLFVLSLIFGRRGPVDVV